LNGLAAKDLMRGTGEIEQHAMRTGRQADDNHRFIASVDKMPRGIVDGDVDMPDMRLHVGGTFSEHKHYA
jgi:hypothetical protein